LPAVAAYLLAVAAGVLAPALLPWLPGKASALNAAILGLAAGALLSVGFTSYLVTPEMLALTLMISGINSYLAMNFTVSTPYTSPTGVEKEMRRAMPAQAAGVLAPV
jgi:hypothetical protein